MLPFNFSLIAEDVTRYNFGRMSHFIENTYKFDSVPVLKTICRQIVVPPLASLRHCQTSQCSSPNEQKMLQMMFFQLKNDEYERLHRQNAIQMQKQFHILKTKLARKAKQQQERQRTAKLMESGSLDKQVRAEQGELVPNLELSAILKMSPQKINLMTKYRTKINGKIILYREAETIARDKTAYCQWYNETHNSPTKSPIYTKMNFLLQKMDNKQRKVRLDRSCIIGRSANIGMRTPQQRVSVNGVHLAH